ncbi:hypothetical protein [Jeotgalibaca sp. A127]|uniref:hypothetical protein n=1 Tax=Jeotgalibaca sp. A127 TaxID=3457324 RepID=UPI003FD3F83B
MNYLTIYGETVKGEIISRLANTVIVKSTDGSTNVVHNTDIGEKKSGRLGDRLNTGYSFDLKECQRIGRSGFKVRKGGY